MQKAPRRQKPLGSVSNIDNPSGKIPQDPRPTEYRCYIKEADLFRPSIMGSGCGDPIVEK